MRLAAKSRRAAAFVQHGRLAGERLAAHGIGFAMPPPQASVSAFLAIGDEIDPTPLAVRLRAEGRVVGLPVMIGKGKPLLFRRWEDGDALAETTWGIREPLAEAPLVLPDVMLVPLLAFDRRGYRLGYGGGFYDRTLAVLRETMAVITIGLAYDELEVDGVPHCDYDERLDWVLTPSGPIRCGTDQA